MLSFIMVVFLFNATLKGNFIMFKERKSGNFIIGVYCLIISFVFLLICTKSSPLYPINDWVDSNAFFTMGKGMMNGKILYRDLFEQKGPLLYFIHGLAYLISNNTFLGVYIFEGIFFAVFLYFSNKIINLYYNKKYSYIALPIISAIVLNLINFSHGDSAEEFTMPLLIISLYYLLKYFKNEYPNPIKARILLLNGFLAGCVMWIKYSLLGFWFGWMIMIFISSVINKRFKDSIKECIVFLLGMFLATLPWIIYFGINGAILDWINDYIFINLNAYSVDYTLIQKFKFIYLKMLQGITNNLFYGVPTIIGLIYVLISNKFIKSIIGKISLIVSICTSVLLVYIGGRGYIYYFLIFAPFIIFGILFIIDIIDKLFGNISNNKNMLVIGAITSIILLTITLKYNHNTYMLETNKKDLFQYKFAKIIEQTPNATLLNYGNLDNGLYLTTGIVPNVKHFEIQNIDYDKYPENKDEQNKYIKEGITDYVLIRVSPKSNIKNIEPNYIWNKYELVAQAKQKFEGKDRKFLLFKKKNLNN